MLDLGIALGIALAGFAAGYGAREIVSYRRRKSRLKAPPRAGSRLLGGLRGGVTILVHRPDQAPKLALFAKSRMEFIRRVDEIVLGLALVM